MKPSIERIQAVVAEAHGIPVEALRWRDGLGTRARKVAWARQEAMFLCRDMLSEPQYRNQVHGGSLPAIGRRFGNRDHSTVIHAIRAVEGRVASDVDVRRRIDALSVGLLI